jgi:hypothetical protein
MEEILDDVWDGKAENGLSLEKLLNEYLATKIDRDGTKCFSVSDMGTCKRKRILARLGSNRKPFDARTKRIFAIGTVNHEYLQDLLEDAGILIGRELTVKFPEVGFVGHCDALVDWHGDKYLYEFKNVHSRKILYGEIDHHYVLQGMTYLMGLEKDFGKIKALRVVLVSRDDWIMKEISNEMFEMAKLWQRKDSLPDELADDDKENWLCGYCNFVEHCPKAQKRIAEKLASPVKKVRIKKEKSNVNANGSDKEVR